MSKLASLLSVSALLVCVMSPLCAETPAVPEWAQPGSATHQQVPPPTDFHRATKTEATPIGVFEGQSDVGGAVVPGSSSYDTGSKQYTINSAGYNIWYTRDEFRYLWKKMSGDVSLAVDATFPNAGGYDDRKTVLVIRQDLEDDAKEIMAGLHGAGLIHLAQRPKKGAEIKEDARLAALPGSKGTAPTRIGIEKHGDKFTLFVSRNGEPMQKIGSGTLKFDEPFYVGIGFCSHLPATSDTTVVSNVILKNAAGKVK